MKRPKGTKDIYGSDQQIYSFIFNEFEKLASLFTILKMETPIFEEASLFQKSVGLESDIVSKELYNFSDKSNRELALRPEGTASIGRAMIENKLLDKKDFSKIYYIGKMFRYEKPQKGRLREFYQIGIEYFLSDDYSMVEIIYIAYKFLTNINISDFTLKINNIATINVREKYKNNLRLFFQKNISLLSEKQKQKITTNPFHILDDKEIDPSLLEKAPRINDCYEEADILKMNKIKSLLEKLKIKYEIDPFLVRGLDYYGGIVFEFVSFSPFLGSKTTIIGGGQYFSLLNNSSLNGMGFAIGVERVFEILKNKITVNNNSLLAYFIFENEQEINNNLNLLFDCKLNNLNIDFNKDIKTFNKLFQNASKLNPAFFIFKEKDNEQDFFTLKSKTEKIIIHKKDIIEKLKERNNEKNQ
ncbi:MAG: histidine--tRNA ligase [Metamycoplasmataceae bacterium]